MKHWTNETADLLHAAPEVFTAHLGEYAQEVAVVDGHLSTVALRTGDVDVAAAERPARAALGGPAMSTKPARRFD